MITEPNIEQTARQKIRQYLLELFELLELEDTEKWPDVSPEIFQQIEQKFLEEVGSLQYYVEGKKHRISILVYGEFVRNLLLLDWQTPQDWFGESEVEKLLKDRPLGIYQPFDQLFCTTDSTQRRVEQILRHVDFQEGKVLFVGDDDLCSIILAHRGFQGEIHVIDLDDRILDFIAQKAPDVHLHKIDLQHDGLPKEFYQYFDTVLLDPPWEKFGAWFFLEKAIFCLNRNRLTSRILLSFSPIYMEFDERAMDHFHIRLAQFGLGFDSIQPCFNAYSLGPENNPELREKLLEYKIPTRQDLPLLNHLRRLPYVHSNLYSIKPLYHKNKMTLKQRWFRMLHSE